MILSINTVTKAGQARQFTMKLNALEVGLDAINEIVNTGDMLLSVHLLEGNSVLALPVDAFDGRPMGALIQALKEQYTQILDKPFSPPAVQRNKLVNLILRQRDRHEAYIVRLQTAVSCTQQRLQRAQESFRNEPAQSRLITHLTVSLERYHEHLVAAVNQRTRIDVDLRKLAW